MTSPRAGTSAEVTHPAAPPSSSSLPSEGQNKWWGGGGSQDAPCAASRGAASPPARRVPARGMEVPLDARPVRASSLLSPQLLVWAEDPGAALSRRSTVARSASSWLALPTHHCMLCEVMSWGCLRRTAPVLDPPVLPGLLAEKHGRIVDPALTGCGFRTAAGLVGVALARTGRDLLTAAGPGVSVRIPLFARGIVVAGSGHAIPSTALVTACGHGTGPFFSLTARGHGQEAGEPGVSCGRV